MTNLIYSISHLHSSLVSTHWGSNERLWLIRKWVFLTARIAISQKTPRNDSARVTAVEGYQHVPIVMSVSSCTCSRWARVNWKMMENARANAAVTIGNFITDAVRTGNISPRAGNRIHIYTQNVRSHKKEWRCWSLLPCRISRIVPRSFRIITNYNLQRTLIGR